MISPHAQTALAQVVVILAVIVFACLALALVTLCVDRARRQKESRARLDAMPAQTPEAVDAGLERLRAELFIPAQRAGGEHRAH